MKTTTIVNDEPFVNDEPLLTIVNDEPSLTIVNDDPSLMIINDDHFFQKDRYSFSKVQNEWVVFKNDWKTKQKNYRLTIVFKND